MMSTSLIQTSNSYIYSILADSLSGQASRTRGKQPRFKVKVINKILSVKE